MDKKDESSAGWFPYVCSSRSVLVLPAHEISTVATTANDVQVKNWFGVVSLVFKHGHQNTLAETSDADSSVVDSSVKFPEEASMMPSLRIKLLSSTLRRT